MNKLRKNRIEKRKKLIEWSKLIRKKGYCEVCLKNKNLNAHHILPKDRYQNLMFEELNGICLCVSCHKYNKYSAHKNGIWFTEWLKVNRNDLYTYVMSKL